MTPGLLIPRSVTYQVGLGARPEAIGAPFEGYLVTLGDNSVQSGL